MCGIAGVALTNPPEPHRAAHALYYALYALQHRGQESAGIVVAHNGESRVRKGMGMVPTAVSPESLKELDGAVGIGHVRYSTTGSSRIENCQPFVITFAGGTLAVAHNGNLVNYADLRAELERGGAVFTSTTDTEVIAHLLARELASHGDLVEALREVMRRIQGAYSLVILHNGTLVAVRDPLGIRPLCLGEVEGGWVVASESAAVDTLGGKLVRDVRPGEVLHFHDGAMDSVRIVRAGTTAHCVFEYIYLARPDSLLDGRLVYDARLRIGELLAEEHGVGADIVSPVPDSGITQALGYSRKSGLPYQETLIKNRYIGRTFIMPEPSLRDLSVRLKLNAVGPNLKDRKVVLVDDSIVRGTTSRRIVDTLRSKGAREVHFRVGSPPLVAPCYLGVDMKSREELIAARKSVEETRVALNADTLGYLSLRALSKAVGMGPDKLCTGCLTGEYPVEVPGEKCMRRQLKLTQFDGKA